MYKLVTRIKILTIETHRSFANTQVLNLQIPGDT